MTPSEYQRFVTLLLAKMSALFKNAVGFSGSALWMTDERNMSTVHWWNDANGIQKYSE